MQEMSDVEIRHIQMFLVLPDQGECCWHLEWKIKEEPEQNELIYRYQVNGYSQANSSSHVLQNGNLFALNSNSWQVSQSMGQLRKGVCGVSIPTSDNPNLEEFSIKKFLQPLEFRFAILDVLDIWNNMPISNMDLKDWVLQGTVNCSCFPCLHQNISVSLPFLHAQCQRPSVVCINCRMRRK